MVKDEKGDGGSGDGVYASVDFAIERLLDFKPQCVVLYVGRCWEERALVIGGVVRQTQDQLVFATLQETGVEGELVCQIVADDRRADPARATLVPRDDPGWLFVSIDDNSVGQIDEGLARIEDVRVARGCLSTTELHRKCGLCLFVEGIFGNIEQNSPVVHVAVAVVWVLSQTPFTSVDTPVDIVQIIPNIALTNSESDAFGEVFVVVIRTPVDAVLFRMKEMLQWNISQCLFVINPKTTRSIRRTRIGPCSHSVGHQR